MQVSNPNNIKIYDLSQGKSLPEFIGEKKRRSLLKKDVDLQRRIELIQDFGMPTVSHTINMSYDQQYIFATGTYKPRVRCFDVKDLSMKFERCIDCEVVAFSILSDDYGKVAYLLRDRHVEFHTQQGTHYKIRFPKFGRDMAYHSGNCDLMVVGAGSEINRLNLDQGRFLKPYETHFSELTKITLSEDHYFIMAGGTNGHVECWDPRSKSRVGVLDCGLGLVDMQLNQTPSISALKYKDALHVGIGTSTGHVLLYDIRNSRPYVVKDHHYELPIHSISFSKTTEAVISSDRKAVKLWNENSGEPITAIQMKSNINDVHVVKDSGLMFLANESPKIHTYFIPMLGPAPKWCSFLDNLTEELEENPVQELYDDYKFLTKKELETLGLSNLIGSSLLRAYMHGYFIDMRLYQKAVAATNPFAYKEYRKQKIAEKIEENRKSRVSVKKLPTVNKKLADRLMNMKSMPVTNKKKKQQKKEAASLLRDSRFKAIFENPDFEVNEESEEYMNVNRVSKSIASKNPKSKDVEENAPIEMEEESSSDEEKEEEKKWVKQSQKVQKSKTKSNEPQMFSIKSSAVDATNQFNTLHDLDQLAINAAVAKKTKAISLEDRLKKSSRKGHGEFFGKRASDHRPKEMTLKVEEKDEKKIKQNRDQQQHRRERKMLRRPLSKIMKDKKKKKPRFKR